MAASMEEICKDLNRLTLHNLELMEDLVRSKAKLEKTMKSAFIHIAKARYIMGNRTVSALQLPNENSSEFSALTTVTRTPSEEKCQERFTINFETSIINKSVKDDGTSLKQRKNKDVGNDLSNGFDESSDKEESNVSQDPIKWFGVLVPQNLRQAQAMFKSTITLTGEIASIQSELEGIQNEYLRLKMQRASLLEKETLEANLSNSMAATVIT